MSASVITQKRDFGFVHGVVFQFGDGAEATRYILSFANGDKPEEIAEALHALAVQMGVRNPVAVETAGVQRIDDFRHTAEIEP